MRNRSAWTLGLAAVAFAAGCTLLDDRPSGRRNRRDDRRNERCGIDVDRWEARIERFKDADHIKKSDFREAKGALLDDLDKLRGDACNAEMRERVNSWLDEVRDEQF